MIPSVVEFRIFSSGKLDTIYKFRCGENGVKLIYVTTNDIKTTIRIVYNNKTESSFTIPNTSLSFIRTDYV